MSLGMYPELGLRDARAMRDEARTLIAKGINPRIARKQKQQAARLAGEHTFIAVYERWLAYRALALEEGRQSTLAQIRRNPPPGARGYRRPDEKGDRKPPKGRG